MKKDYLKSLDKALNEYNVENRKEVLKKYSKRYEFGLDAGLTDEKIEEMLGDPIEVAKKLADVVEINFEEKRNYDVTINLTTEDLDFVFSKDEGIHVELEELNVDDYQIEKDDTHLFIKRKKANYFGSKIDGKIIVEIPKGLEINSYTIETISTDINALELNAKEIYIRNTSSDINISNINADNIKIETVSGDFNSNNIKTKNLKIDTVSGDISIDSLIADELSVSSISGDVSIPSGYVSKVRSNSVSGDTIINGENVGTNVKNSVKNTINKIKKAIIK